MKICIAGKNNIAVNAVKYLIETLKFNKDDLLIVTNKNDSCVDSWQKSLKKCALDNGISIYRLEDVYDIENLLFISLEFDRIIKTEKFKTNRLFNIHFSLLPSYKGMYTSALPIINGEQYSGVTLHKIDNGIDTGDIIDQIKFEIALEDTSRDLYLKYIENSFELFKNNINNLINNEIKSKLQPFLNSSYYSKKSIDYTDVKIDFNKTSFEIYNQIRAFIFPEYQLPVILGKKVYKVRMDSEKIPYNTLVEKGNTIVISGIDGYKVIADITE